jgi:SagB-type dehydrogenase family enzyme
MSDSDTIRHYHKTTKHTLQRYAAGPEALDWDDQPEAFRWFDDAPKTDLPLIADSLKTLYIDLYQPAKIEPRPLSLENIGGLLELSFGLAAWKQYGDAKWPLRCNPSSGNLHAEEAYVVCNGIAGLVAGVHHYLSRDHQLEQRCRFAADTLPANTLLIGISSIQWREAWKYGERAYRYCQLDTGHAIATLRYAAATLGWQMDVLDSVSDQQLAALLGLGRSEDFGNAEHEHPDVLLQITSSSETNSVTTEMILNAATNGAWQGQANTLSERHMYKWPIIDTVSAAAQKPATQKVSTAPHDYSAPLSSPCTLEAALLIRRRRSAQAFDGQTSISSEAFYRMLDMTLPRRDMPPWDCTPWNDNINLILFVHRVEGLKPGLYALVRNPDSFESFKTAVSREQFQWQSVDGCPSHLPLYTLVNANGQNLAATLACHQGIAGQSCFSLAMIADTAAIEDNGWQYRTLYWEAGMIGQVLYLEAEAAGIQGTGIGCYFDDALHEALGIQNERWQDLYHFTVGKGIHDGRIQTIAPYAHLSR